MNLKVETLDALEEVNKTIEDIDYCHIYIGAWYREQKILCQEDFDIDKIDITYDSGYGTQAIFGFIVFKDDTWLSRREYDGSEWWEYFSKPERIISVQSNN